MRVSVIEAAAAVLVARVCCLGVELSYWRACWTTDGRLDLLGRTPLASLRVLASSVLLGLNGWTKATVPAAADGVDGGFSTIMRFVIGWESSCRAAELRSALDRRLCPLESIFLESSDTVWICDWDRFLCVRLELLFFLDFLLLSVDW